MLRFKQVVCTLLFCCVIHVLFAQESLKISDKQLALFEKSPVWITLIDDPNTNYFVALTAYKTFWKNRKEPKEENEIIGEGKRPKKILGLFKSKEEREEEEALFYKYDCKRFEHWQQVVKPYVQEDGRILSTEEQLDIWKTQRQ